MLRLGDPCCGLLTLGLFIWGCLCATSQQQQQQQQQQVQVVNNNTVTTAPAQPAVPQIVYVYGQQTGGQFPMGQFGIPGPGPQMMGQYSMGASPMMGQQVMGQSITLGPESMLPPNYSGPPPTINGRSHLDGLPSEVAKSDLGKI